MWKRGTELPCPSRAYAAALGPADDREEPDALLVQPGALLAGREVDVGLGPAARPVVLRRGRSRRVPSQSCQRQLAGVLDAAAGAARASRRGTARRTTRTPGRRGTARGSWSSRITRRPASASSAVATRPARPAPTTMTSASDAGRLPGRCAHGPNASGPGSPGARPRPEPSPGGATRPAPARPGWSTRAPPGGWPGRARRSARPAARAR